MAQSSKRKTRRVVDETSEAEVAQDTNNTGAEKFIGPAWAVWILSRFPIVRYKYQKWSKSMRIFVAILCYLVAMPIIPIVIAAWLYIKDPEGFKKKSADANHGGHNCGLVWRFWLGGQSDTDHRRHALRER